MGVELFFKTIRCKSRHSTSKGSHLHLRKKLEKGMILRNATRFVIATKKLSAIIDRASSSPKDKGKVYSEYSIKNLHAGTGFINEIDVHPNVWGVMKASNDFC